MSGIQVGVEVQSIESVASKLGQLSSLNRALVLEAAGALVESQTRRRLESEKTAPDGAPWRPNRSGTPILVQTGHLMASIHYAVAGDTVRIGSGLVYAAIHQLGGTIVPKNARRLAFPGGDGGLVFASKVTIPARPYLGVSAENEAEIETALVTYISSFLN